MASSSYLLNKEFWKGTAERAIRTACQAILATGALDIVTAAEFDLGQAATIGGFAALATILTCIGAGAVTKDNGPSFTKAEILNPVPPVQPEGNIADAH